MTPAHQGDTLAEMVCSNSFRSDDGDSNAVGLLHREMRTLGSIIMREADVHKVPAGSALAVDRDLFSERRHQRARKPPERHDRPRTHRHAADRGPDDRRYRPAHRRGPRREHRHRDRQGRASPSSTPSPPSSTATASTWMSHGWRAAGTRSGRSATARIISTARWTRTSITPSSRDFVDGDKTEFKDWEKDTPYFEGCMPIEVMAERGPETLRFGPMKGVGLDNPRTGRWPYAVVQLRQDNALGTLWNMVGFQTKLKHAAQVELFRTIPGGSKRPSSPASAGSTTTATLFFIRSPASYSTASSASNRRRISASRARSRAAKAMSKAPRSGWSPRASPPPNLAAATCRRRPRNRARRPARPHHRRRRRGKLSANERQFRPSSPPLAEDVRKKDRKLGYTQRAGDEAGGMDEAGRRRRRLTFFVIASEAKQSRASFYTIYDLGPKIVPHRVRCFDKRVFLLDSFSFDLFFSCDCRSHFRAPLEPDERFAAVAFRKPV